MADVTQLVARIRSHGANILLDRDRLRIVNKAKLPDGALEFVKTHGKEIAAFLEREAEFEERAATLEYSAGLPRRVAEDLASILLASPPKEISPADWTWFVSKAAAIADQRRTAAA